MSHSHQSSYVSIRDDSGVKSLSSNERVFLRDCALASSSRVLRGDGRGPGQVRKVRLTLGRWHNGAECTVQWGSATRVTALCTAELLPPSPDYPSEGTVSLSVDLSPMASSAFSYAPPLTTTPSGPSSIPNLAEESQKLLSNRILRCLERTLLVGGALDTEALCVQSGHWVWRLNVHVTVLDHGGNILDASVLAAVAALRHYRKPQVDLVESNSDNNGDKTVLLSPTLIHSDAREPSPLPLHHTPLTMSFALVHADDAVLSTSSTSTVAVLVDPTDREELVQTGTITMAMNMHSETCLLDFGGGCELKPTQLKECWKLGQECILQLCQMLEQTLEDANQKAQKERLDRLVMASSGGEQEVSSPPEQPDNVAYLVERQNVVDTDLEFKDVTQDIHEAVKEVNREEEAYRLQALDYSLGHVAAKVKENPDDDDKKKAKGAISSSRANAMAGSLLAAMLKSAEGSSAEPLTENGAKEEDVVMTEEVTKPAATTNDVRSKEDIDEFEQFAKQKQQEQTAMEIDSDEEETTTMLQSEFQSVEKPATSSANETPKNDITQAAAPPLQEDDNNVDDLAMAITKKKKKKKKSK